MSKIVEYPNGYRGVANDKAAANLAKKEGHRIIGEAPGHGPKKAVEKAPENRDQK